MLWLERLFDRQQFPGLILALALSALPAVIPAPLLHWVPLVVLALVTVLAAAYIANLTFLRIVPRRFANLVYLFDDDCNIAMIKHPFHKRLQPPGARLKYHEMPHEAVRRVVRDELGLLDSETLSFVPNDERVIGRVRIVPAPVQVQIEGRKQRLGVSEHYDFVYLCRVRGVRPPLRSSLNPQWMSIRQVSDATKGSVEDAPFEDVLPTLERLKLQLS